MRSSSTWIPTFILAAALLAPGPSPAAAQTLDRPLRAYLDCNGFFCDTDFFVEEVSWVNFVRDRQSADVHVLGTRQSTSGGGSEFVLEFRGRATFEGQSITLRGTTESDATEDDTRTTLGDLIRQGLAPFAAATSRPPMVEVLPPAEADGEAMAPEDDPWDRWTFQIGVNGFMNGESQQQFLHSNGSVSASRVTEEWKVRFGVSGSFNSTVIETEATSTEFTQESYSGRFLGVRSIGPHWSVGGIASWSRSTFANLNHSARLSPAVEYNVYPYSESNRSLLTVLYTVGPRYNEYDEVTIFLESSETLIEQQVVISYDVTQPWGNIDASLSANHFITKFSDGQQWDEPQYNVNLGGGFQVRLFKGFSARVFGNVEMVRGQIQLRGGDLTPEEILTRQRELSTDFRYFLNFGISYRFGSIFTSVVNPRMDRLN